MGAGGDVGRSHDPLFALMRIWGKQISTLHVCIGCGTFGGAPLYLRICGCVDEGWGLGWGLGLGGEEVVLHTNFIFYHILETFMAVVQ